MEKLAASFSSITTLEQWRKWAEEGWSLLPYVTKYEAAKLPEAWSGAWEASSPYSFVLESGKQGRYTYLGLQPVSVLQGKDDEAEIIDLDTGSRDRVHGRPLHLLKQWMAPYRTPSLSLGPTADIPPFLGGCVGFLGYDVVRSLEDLPQFSADDAGLPDYLWMRMEEVWIHDAQAEVLYCVVHTSPDQGMSLEELYHEAEIRADSMLSLWHKLTELATADGSSLDGLEKERRLALAQQVEEQLTLGGSPDPDSKSSFSCQSFEQAVRAIQQYIRQGDVFQVNLSVRQEMKLHARPEVIYEWLRLLNPSPYMGMIRSPEFSLVSASPELLVRLVGDSISTRPIAGTRRRGRSTQEDDAMAKELMENEKERAEHIMLVDLERNDIGRVAAYGSVHVPELLTVEYYSHVMHLVSQVEGTLAPGKSAYDVIAALFPGGTITGAPKIRTMEIIEELEPVRRGPYTGSMGWIDYSGNMELNIIIRTLAASGSIGYIQAGAGIVIDSDPYREYRECHNKAKAMIKAVLCSETEARTETHLARRG